MSIASEITSIGENLKKDYQAIANLGADLTNVDKNIENIAELLDGVYDNLPKTEYQEGTEVNLGKTTKGKLDYENGVVGIGQTEQDGTPTPSTPIAINSVTGNQDVVVQNKNLCTEMEQGDVSTSTGEASSYQPTTSGFIRSKDYIPVKPSEVITVSYKNTATSSIQIVIFEYNANKTYIGFYYSNASTYTRTLGNETAYIKIRLQDTTNTLSNNTEIQVEYGNTKTSYVEHQEHSYQLSLGDKKLYDECTIVGSPDNWKFVDNWYKLNLKDIGLHWNPDTVTSNWYSFYTNSYSNKFVSNANSKCNRLIYESDQLTILNNALPRFSVNATQFIRVKINGTITTVQQLYEYFTNNETYIVGKLATPIETPITDETLISQLNAWYNAHSNNGTTIITSNGDLPMIIKCRGLKGE